MGCAGSPEGIGVVLLVVSVGQPVDSEAILLPQPLQLVARAYIRRSSPLNQGEERWKVAFLVRTGARESRELIRVVL